MRSRRWSLPQAAGVLFLASACVRADPGDVDSSHDYPAFPRLPGYLISDYDEDNPAAFDFPVARPLTIDVGHVEMLHVKGHRYVIRYEPGPGARVPSLYQTQKYYEKVAADNGFTMEKSGAVGDVTETFHRPATDHDVWVYLEPSGTFNVLTVVESTGIAPPPPLVPLAGASGAATPPAVTASVATVPSPPAPVATPRAATADSPLPNLSINPTSQPVAFIAAPAPAPPAPPPPPPPVVVDPSGEALFSSLSNDGRVVVPFIFRPGKDDLAPESQPLVDRVAAMMKNHPTLFLRIEGHTDNTGDPDSNLRLSANRAFAVVAMLVLDHVEKKRLDPVGVGGLQPLADNNTPEGREKNRRIELVMWQKYPAFHSPASNGQNYYPNPGPTNGTSRAGL